MGWEIGLNVNRRLRSLSLWVAIAVMLIVLFYLFGHPHA
jgi:hypothetical protein